MGMGEGDMEMINTYDLSSMSMPGSRAASVKNNPMQTEVPSQTRFPPTQNSRGERGSVPANHHTLHRSPKPSTHLKTVNYSEHSVGKTAHSYSGRQKSD